MNMIFFVILLAFTLTNQIFSFQSFTKTRFTWNSITRFQSIIKYQSKLSPLFSNPYDEIEMNKDGFTQKQLLKEETEAPFRTVRIYIYFALLAAAGLGSLIGFTKILAMNVNNNVNMEDMNELYTNLAINLTGLPIVSYFWKRDLDDKNNILNRIQKGGSLAGLKIRMMIDSELCVVKLSDLRRERGIDKRVVIIAAEKELLKSSLLTSLSQSANLINNDLLIIPLLIETSITTSNNKITNTVSDSLLYELTSVNIETLFEPNELIPTTTSSNSISDSNSIIGGSSSSMLAHIGLPMIISTWNNVLKKEFEVALKQQPDALKKG